MARRFKIADSLQQVVGGFLLAGPFVVTAEVWEFASFMSLFNTSILGTITVSIGYAALYKADRGRDIDKERKIAGIPLRFVSLMVVSVLSVYILVYLFSVQQTLALDNLTVIKGVVLSSMFSTIGAATADSIFPGQKIEDTGKGSKQDISKPN